MQKRAIGVLRGLGTRLPNDKKGKALGTRLLEIKFFIALSERA
jgi:hypothetical protein